MKKSILIPALIILSAAFIAGCGKKQATEIAAQPGAAAPEVVSDYIPTVGNYSTVTECPVTKDKFKVGKDTKAVAYKGKIYYFCCPSCVGEFKSNPEKYK